MKKFPLVCAAVGLVVFCLPMAHFAKEDAKRSSVHTAGNIQPKTVSPLHQFSGHLDSAPRAELVTSQAQMDSVLALANSIPEPRYGSITVQNGSTYLAVFLGENDAIRTADDITVRLYNCDPIRHWPENVPEGEYVQQILVIIDVSPPKDWTAARAPMRSPWFILELAEDQLAPRINKQAGGNSDMKVRREFRVMHHQFRSKLGRCTVLDLGSPPEPASDEEL